jgi:hypothetical protein
MLRMSCHVFWLRIDWPRHDSGSGSPCLEVEFCWRRGLCVMEAVDAHEIRWRIAVNAYLTSAGTTEPFHGGLKGSKVV